MNSFKNNFEQSISDKHPIFKKLGFYSVSITVICYLILAFASLTSCSSDDSSPSEETAETPPTLTLESGSEDIIYGIVGNPENGTLQHSVKALAPDGFSQLVIQKVVDGVATEYETIDNNHPNYVANSNTYTYNLNYILGENDVDKTLIFKAIVTDVNNNTATLDFAETLTELPMIKTTLTLETVMPYDGSEIRPSYLYIDGTAIEAVNLNDASDYGILTAAVFGANESDGYYLASPEATNPSEMVEGFTEKATTKFKAANDAPYELALDSEYGIYDAHNVKSKFNELNYNAHEQKAQQIDTPGLRFFFKTDDGRTGVLQVVAYELLGEYSFLQIEILITKNVDLG